MLDGTARSESTGDAKAAGGSIRLLTQCRVLGYVFNPISMFYCHDVHGALATVVAEVNNTFGERHLYLLDGRKNASTGSTRDSGVDERR